VIARSGPVATALDEHLNRQVTWGQNLNTLDQAHSRIRFRDNSRQWMRMVKARQPFCFGMKDGRLFAFAGLRIRNSVKTITTLRRLRLPLYQPSQRALSFVTVDRCYVGIVHKTLKIKMQNLSIRPLLVRHISSGEFQAVEAGRRSNRKIAGNVGRR
jgi:hypothetical protein